MNKHTQYMQRCWELADIAKSKGESPVGSVVVKDGVIIGEASEKSRQMKDITRHAEVLAIMDALDKHGSCSGAVLYTNVEPCLLCCYVVRHHNISEVIFSKHCGELGGTTKPFNLLITNDILSWSAAPKITIYQTEE